METPNRAAADLLRVPPPLILARQTGMLFSRLDYCCLRRRASFRHQTSDPGVSRRCRRSASSSISCSGRSRRNLGASLCLSLACSLSSPLLDPASTETGGHWELVIAPNVPVMVVDDFAHVSGSFRNLVAGPQTP